MNAPAEVSRVKTAAVTGFVFFDGMADGNRVAILLDFLGRKVRVILDGAAIRYA